MCGFTPTTTTRAPRTARRLASASSSTLDAATPSLSPSASALAADSVVTRTSPSTSTPGCRRPPRMAPFMDPVPSIASDGRRTALAGADGAGREASGMPRS